MDADTRVIVDDMLPDSWDKIRSRPELDLTAPQETFFPVDEYLHFVKP